MTVSFTSWLGDHKHCIVPTVGVCLAGAALYGMCRSSPCTRANKTQQSCDGSRFGRLARALLGGRRSTMSMPHMKPPCLEEKGMIKSDGTREQMNERLYVQLRVLDFTSAQGREEGLMAAEAALKRSALQFVVYKDVCSSTALGVLCWTKDPHQLATEFNDLICSLICVHDGVIAAEERSGWSMFGRTYSAGHEISLKDALFDRPIRHIKDSNCQYAVWYPMRRKATFYTQPPEDRCSMLLSHAAIGKSYSDIGAVHDVRLKCFGMDPHDNEFVIGLVSSNINSISRVVEDMRATRHTAEFVESLGPFFTGLRVCGST